MLLIVMYCFLLSTYHYFLGIDIVGMKFFVYDELELELLAGCLQKFFVVELLT